MTSGSFSEILDPDYVESRLSSHPFIVVEGLFNIRELGGYTSEKYPSRVTKSSRFFRAAEPSLITDDGKAKVKSLGITKMFDLRSSLEFHKTLAAGRPLEIDGVTVVRVPVFDDKDYSPEMIMRRFGEYSKGIDGFVPMYMEILEAGSASFEIILRHIKDFPNEGCIFHCTGGKDRSGIVAAIILSISGVSDDDIATDYALTRIGLDPLRDYMISRIQAEPALQGNEEDALRMLSSTRETILLTLRELRIKYGSIEGYLKKHTKLTDIDIETIRQNLLVEKSHL